MKRQTLAVLLASFLLALALHACGDGGEDASTTASAPARGSGGASESGKTGKGEESAAGAGASFVPKPHDDSGGGSEQFQVNGGDVSVQEYGEEAGGSEFVQAASFLHGFLDARATEEWAAACSYLAPELFASIKETAAQLDAGKRSCAAGLEAMTSPAGKEERRLEAAQADVGSVRVEGESGFVIYRAAKAVYALAIARADGEWKVAGLLGYPLS